MLNEHDLQRVFEDLGSSDPNIRSSILASLMQEPTGDPRLHAAIEALLTDRDPCVFGAPLKFVEIRWIAAYALAAELRSCGVKRNILLKSVISPVDNLTLERMALSAFGEQAYQWTAMKRFKRLRKIGQLPNMNLEL